MPKDPISPTTQSVHFGVTEGIHLCGLLLLGVGISLTAGIAWACIVIGLFLVRTAEQNARERSKES